ALLCVSCLSQSPHHSPSSLFLLFFFLYCVHLYLLSFPTRRSSDLAIFYRGQAWMAPCSLMERLLSFHYANNRLIGDGYSNCCKVYPNGDARSIGAGLCLDCESKRLDRKSTRLNSSHVSISYAVFCLKKKT